MTFADYPGHLVAFGVLLAAAGLTFAGFYCAELRRPERRRHRWLFMAIQLAVIAALLLIAWNPSTWQTSEVFSRNAVLTLFDTSESMSIADDEDQTRLDKALDRFNRHFRPADSDGPEYILYGFDRHAYHCGWPDQMRRWGAQTNLYSVLSVLEEYDPVASAGTPAPEAASPSNELAGVVLFTDGQSDDKTLETYRPVLPEEIPVVLVGVGSRRRAPDVAVRSVTAPARAWIDSACPVTAVLTATNVAAESLTVEFLADGNVIDSRSVRRDAFTADRQSAETTVEFVGPADRLGTHLLSVRVAPVAREINTANNERSAAVDIIQEQPLRVLLYCQWADFNAGKIRQALTWDQRIDLEFRFDVIRDPVLAQRSSHDLGHAGLPRNAEEFGTYDVIILGACDLNKLTGAQLEGLYGFVTNRGGGLLLLPGRTVTTLAAWGDEKSAALLPVVLGDNQQRLWPPKPDAIDVTFEAQVTRMLDPMPFQDANERISPYYEIARGKPASRTLATVQEVPIVTTHRLGRGRVGLLNASKLFTLYREDRQGGLLSTILSRLIVHLGKTPSRGAGMELFVERSAENPQRVAFGAYIVDEAFEPVTGANVLLTVGDRVVRMQPTGQGRYTAEMDWGPRQSVVATVQAETGGVFLGERTVATTLPPIRDEMSEVDLDEGFLQALALRLGARYVHIDTIDDATASQFVARRQTGTTEKIRSVWPTWPLLVALCLLLSVQWFLRRAIGLV